jgi:hypothetical protein
MSRSRSALRASAVVALSLAFAPLARAQATRTWVSGVGDDVNPCSRTAPCKTFAGAISKTAAGGEISVLDPGGYGGVTITKSMTIDGGTGAGWGSILASGTSAVIINAAGIDVTLRNLSINGGAPTAPGVNGVRILNANRVSIENCQIFNFTGGTNPGGIRDERTNAAPKKLFVKDTVVRNNAVGIAVIPTNAFTTGALVNVHAVGNNGAGISVNGGHLHISNSEASGNAGDGINLNQGGVGTFVVLDNVGVHANGGAGVNLVAGGANLSNMIITDNTSTGVAGAAVGSFQNNKINGNGGAGNNLPVGSTNLAVK